MGLRKNLIHYWKCDEASGTDTLDEVSGSHFDIQNINSFDEEAIIGSSMYFDGNQDYAINHVPWNMGNAWSVNFWMYCTQLQTDDILFEKRDTSDDYNWLQIAFNGDDNLEVTINDSSSSNQKVYQGNSTLTTSTWYMITVTWDGTNLKMYVNSSEETPTKVTDDSVTQANDSMPLVVGANSRDTSANEYKGYIDEIGIWSRTLGNSEITQLYNSGAGLEYPWPWSATVNGVSSIAAINGVVATNIAAVNNQ